MDLLVFRVDIGYALHNPCVVRLSGSSPDSPAVSPPDSKVSGKYFNVPGFRNAIGFHIAIGYPF
jgi:hypothetical protein